MESTPMYQQLTKSKFLSGLQCIRRLWLEAHREDLAAPVSAFREQQLHQGVETGLLARKAYPGGYLVAAPAGQKAEAVLETRMALAGGYPALFEAAFMAENTFVRADILACREDGRWDLIEVKSSTRVQDEHIPDVALQKHILSRNGLVVAGCFLMHLNSRCTYPDLADLFQTRDVSTLVDSMQPEVAAYLQQYKAVLWEPHEPQIAPGDHCKSGGEKCPFYDYCWREMPAHSVYTIPRLHRNRRQALLRQGIVDVKDIRDKSALNPPQQLYVDAVQTGDAAADLAAIRRKLSELSYPLYFLDFETLNPAVPRFEGMQPYAHYPFQYSCHILHSETQWQHYEYLHPERSDPRLPFLQSLIAAIGADGRIVVYNARFERGVLESLAAAYPEYAVTLKALADRLWDLWEIFDRHYKHPGFGSSSSIKAVLPVLVPALSYQTLAVQDGTAAQIAWERMTVMPPGPEQEQLAADLEDYCRLDTWAMVELYKVLRELFGG